MLTSKCPQCGSYNDNDAAECYFCKAPLPGKKKPKSQPRAKSSAAPSGKPQYTLERDRPFGVSVLASVFFLIAGYSITSGLCLISMNDTNIKSIIDGSPYVYFLYLLVNLFWLFQANLQQISRDITIHMIVYFSVAALSLTLGWGLWNMKQWIRILIMVFQISFLLSLIFLPENPATEFLLGLFTVGSGGVIFLVRLIIGIASAALFGYLFFWLAFNDKLFRKHK